MGLFGLLLFLAMILGALALGMSLFLLSAVLRLLGWGAGLIFGRPGRRTLGRAWVLPFAAGVVMLAFAGHRYAVRRNRRPERVAARRQRRYERRVRRAARRRDRSMARQAAEAAAAAQAAAPPASAPVVDAQAREVARDPVATAPPTEASKPEAPADDPREASWFEEGGWGEGPHERDFIGGAQLPEGLQAVPFGPAEAPGDHAEGARESILTPPPAKPRSAGAAEG